MAGIFAQTVVFGSTFSGAAMAQDLKEGIVDRFRTLPMSPSAVLIGRTNSDLVLNAISMLIMMATGLLVGWRVNTSFASFLAAVGLLLLFSYAFSWVMALLGMTVRTPETINNASFMILFPITFISNAFVQSSTLPTPLRIFAEWNPVSALVQAARELFGNLGNTPVPDTWPMQHAVATVLIGSAVMLLIFVPLAVRKFESVSSR
jgi:ABC-2 type transport system permease protein